MLLYYKPFKATGHPKGMTVFTVTKNSWRIYLLCSSANLGDCYIYNDANSLQSAYKSQYKNMMKVLAQNCESGKPLSVFYDKKKCHPISTVNIEGVEEKIWRIRQGDLRLCFVYLPPEKRIIILTLLVKKSDKLKPSEEQALQFLAKSVLTDDIKTFAQRIL